VPCHELYIHLVVVLLALHVLREYIFDCANLHRSASTLQLRILRHAKVFHVDCCGGARHNHRNQLCFSRSFKERISAFTRHAVSVQETVVSIVTCDVDLYGCEGA
jgi:hypothetical protein